MLTEKKVTSQCKPSGEINKHKITGYVVQQNK